MSGDSEWTVEFAKCVNLALHEQPLELETFRRCLELSLECDVRVDEQVRVAFHQLLRLAGKAWKQQGRDAGEQPIFAAMDIALSAYRASGDSYVIWDLATRLKRHGQSQLALTLYDQAIVLRVPPRSGLRPSALASLQNNRGNLLRELGNLVEAELALNVCLSELDPNREEEWELLHVALNNLATVYQFRRDYPRARDLFIQSLEIMERSDADPVKLAVTFDNLAGVEIDLARQTGPLWVSDMINATAAHHLDNAQGYLDRAQELLVQDLPGTAEDYVVVLLNNADLALIWNDTGGALASSSRAREVMEQGRVSRQVRLNAMAVEGDLLVRTGRPAEAVSLLRPLTEEYASRSDAHELPPRLFTTLFRAAAQIGDRALAERAARLLVDVDDDMIERLLAATGESVANRIFAEFNSRAQRLLGPLLDLLEDNTAPPWLYDLLLARKGVLSERQGSAWLQARARGGRADKLLDQVRALRAEVSRIDLEGAGFGAIGRAREAYRDAERRLAHVETQLHRELGRALTTPRRIRTGDIQSQLGSDSLLVDLTMTERLDGEMRYAMFLVRSKGLIEYRDLGPLNEVDDQISAALDVLATPPSDAADRVVRSGVLHRLMPSVFSPDDHLPPHIIVAPTGLWGGFPFALLRDENNVPLIEHHTITVVPSARWLVADSRSRDKESGGTGSTSRAPQVLGDPDFDLGLDNAVSASMSLLLPPLDHAAREVLDVAGSLKVDPVVGPDVTRARLFELDRPRVLHVATHGVFLDAFGSTTESSEPSATRSRLIAGAVVREPDDPSIIMGLLTDSQSEEPASAAERASAGSVANLHEQRVEWLGTIGPTGQLSRSALLVAGFNRWLAGMPTTAEVGSGIVTAGEFSLLDLTGTALVVLSACQTGVGAVNYADGTLIGLRGAALAAGAACCVSSLWEVDDERTADLMTAFYGGLSADQKASQALRTAQLAIRDRDDDPYFWAGWVAEGNARQPYPRTHQQSGRLH